MKPLYTLFFCFIQVCLSAQNEYFLNSPRWGMKEETQWSQFAPVFGTRSTYYVLGDTLLNGMLYVKIFQEGIAYQEGENNDGTGNGLMTETPYVNIEPIALLRSQDGIMYKWNAALNVEELLYNFNAGIGEALTISSSITTDELFVTEISTLFLGGIERKMITTANTDGQITFPPIIEGVGSPYGLWQSEQGVLDGSVTFECFSINEASYSVDSNEATWLLSSDANCAYTVDVVERDIPVSAALYPNPVNSMLTLESATPILHLRIQNTIGQEVYRTRPNSSMCRMDVSHFPAGIYLATLETSLGLTTYRIIKE